MRAPYTLLATVTLVLAGAHPHLAVSAETRDAGPRGGILSPQPAPRALPNHLAPPERLTGNTSWRVTWAVDADDPGEVRSLAWTAAAGIVALRVDGALEFWNPVTGRRKVEHHERYVALSDDARWAAAAGVRNELLVYRLQPRIERVASSDGGAAALRGTAAVLPGDSTVVFEDSGSSMWLGVIGGEGFVQVRDHVSFRGLRCFYKHDREFPECEPGPRPTTVRDPSGRLLFFATPTCQALIELGQLKEVFERTAALASTHRKASDRDGSVSPESCIAPGPGVTLLSSPELGFRPVFDGARFSPDSKALYVLGDVRRGRRLHRLDVRTGTWTELVKSSSMWETLTVSGNGRVVAAIDAEGITWTIRDGGTVEMLEIRPGRGSTYALSPDGSQLAVADRTGIITVRELPSGRVIATSNLLRTHIHPVTRLAVSQDGRWLASADSEAGSFLWNATTGEVVRPLLDYGSVATSFAFRPDGNAVAVRSSKDHIVREFDLRAATAQPPTEIGPADEATYTADGKYLVRLIGGKVLVARDRENRDTMVSLPDERSDYRSIRAGAGGDEILVRGPKTLLVAISKMGAVTEGDRAAIASSPIRERNSGFDDCSRPTTFSADGRFAACGRSWSETYGCSRGHGVRNLATVFIWDAVSEERLCDVGRWGAADAAAFSDDARSLAVARKSAVVVLNWLGENAWCSPSKGNEELGLYPWNDEATSVAFGRGHSLFVGTRRGRVVRFDRPAAANASN